MKVITEKEATKRNPEYAIKDIEKATKDIIDNLNWISQYGDNQSLTKEQISAATDPLRSLILILKRNL